MLPALEGVEKSVAFLRNLLIHRPRSGGFIIPPSPQPSPALAGEGVPSPRVGVPSPRRESPRAAWGPLAPLAGRGLEPAPDLIRG
jgi:hypothetical protein